MLTMPYDKFTIGLGDDRTVTIRAQAIACDALRLIWALEQTGGHYLL
jgi:hypothetical protein